ncbi:MAG: GntR family transcriptional regulator [Verrucomicrobiaceae bacterium]|nr:MAG: GntR family transcriptional regulator [Verrucomicrobiaceae bacterium]
MIDSQTDDTIFGLDAGATAGFTIQVVHAMDHQVMDGLRTAVIVPGMSGNIERRSIAAQLADRIEQEIRAGTWKAELPGKRTLADRHGVNVKTCAAAIELLAQRDLIGPATVGKGRTILPQPKSRKSKGRLSDKRLLVIHQSGGVINVEDYHLLQRMCDIWTRSHGEVGWAVVDFPRCKSPGPQLDVLIKRHSADALLMLMPGSGWHREAHRRLPFYLSGGPYEKDVPLSLGACKIDHEVKRVVQHLRDLGHRRIIFPTEGMDEGLWHAILDGLRPENGAKPEIGTWEDHCPQFPANVPEAWDAYWGKTFARLKPTAVIVHEDAHLLSLYGYCFVHGLKIPSDVSVVSINYEPRFEWLQPRPAMMRFPANLALAHFQHWIEGGLKPIGMKFFPLEMAEGGSLAKIR